MLSAMREKLGQAAAQRIVRKTNWLAKNAEIIQPKGLRSNLAGFSQNPRGRLSNHL